jgi:cycloeucalenol cycloisomerase
MHSSWFSANPSKAWAEKLFLLYSPAWIAFVGVVLVLRLPASWGDAGFLAFGLATAAPLFVLPLLRPAATDRDRPLIQRSWFRLNVWIAVFVFSGTYFFTHYFFDLLGMRYRFPTAWNLSAAHVGHSDGTVPLFMYPLTQAYFVTYHTVMTVVLRRVRVAFPGSRVAPLVALVVMAYATAFAETLAMANPKLADFFWYEDRARMLSVGSLLYACYFLVSVPLYARLDEPDRPRASLGAVLLDALAASMLVFIILEAWAHAIGPL